MTAPQPRLLFIDNLRWSMIILVISMHAADTYSPLGNWYFTDRSPLSRPEVLIFAEYQMFLQSFFMGLLFFVAAYFAPASLARKGRAKFIRDRLFRLGMPVLFYMFVLGPVTEYFVAHSWTSTRPTSFANEWVKHIRNGEFLQENGPLWFCLALLIFSIVYAFLDKPGRPASPPPGSSRLAGFALALAAASILVRLVNPPTVLNMHLTDFPQYVLMFIAGIAAARGEWMSKMSYTAGIWWLAASFVIAPWIWIGVAEATCAFCPGETSLSAARLLGFRTWEAFTCVGVSYGLLCAYRERFNEQNRFTKFLSDNAFAVYVFHPPIVILGARMMQGFDWHPFVKFGLLTVFGVVVTYTLSAAVFRRIPYLRAII